MPANGPSLLMFFYGTLKRGERNHDAYCFGALSVLEASVQGNLYDLPAGYPALVVPRKSVRATGTTDHARDARGGHPLPTDGRSKAPGNPVFGELFLFDDPRRRLPNLDLLEGFTPGDPTSEYRRVLLPAWTRDGTKYLAWTYVVDAVQGRFLPAGRWIP